MCKNSLLPISLPLNFSPCVTISWISKNMKVSNTVCITVTSQNMPGSTDKSYEQPTSDKLVWNPEFKHKILQTWSWNVTLEVLVAVIMKVSVFSDMTCSLVPYWLSEEYASFIVGIMKQGTSGKYNRYRDRVDQGMVVNGPIGEGRQVARMK